MSGAVRARLSLRCSCREPNLRVNVELGGGFAPPECATCSACGAEQPLAVEVLSADGGLRGCLACGHPELYQAKDFPRAAGIAIVVLAAVLAPFTYYLSLVGAALLDWVIYQRLPEVVHCYSCDAEHRGFALEPRHPRFDRTIAERLRYGERAVMGTPMREGGTAGAPDPEH